MKNISGKVILFILFCSMLVGCMSETNLILEDSQTSTSNPTKTPTKTSTPTPSHTSTHTPTATITPTPTAISGGYPLVAYLIANTQNYFLRIDDLQQRTTLVEIPLISAAFKISFSKDGKLLAYGIYEKNEIQVKTVLQLFHLETGELETGPSLRDNQELESMSFSPNGEWLMYQFFDHSNRHPEIYLYHIPSKRITYVDNGFSKGYWTEDNNLIYQQYYSSNMKFNPVSQQRQIIQISPQTKLFANFISSGSFEFMQEANSTFLGGINSDGQLRYNILVNYSTGEEILLGQFENDPDITSPYEGSFVDRVFVSPNGEYFNIEICTRIYASPRKNCKTYLSTKDDLPLTQNSKSIDIFPLGWSPDSEAFLAYRPRDGVDAEIVIYESKTNKELLSMKLIDNKMRNRGYNAWAAENIGVAYYWGNRFDVSPYIPPDSSTTTPSP